MKVQRFGRYLLLDKIASGGMAEVFRAKLVGEGNFQRIIAIKKILPHVSEDAEFVAMFHDEANLTVQLQHANIGQVFEFAKNNDTYYIAMEYISGKDLKTLWNYQKTRKQPIPLEYSCYIVQKMAEGLDYAHRKTSLDGTNLCIVHRDVSPHNVLISWEGEVKVIDFGIAKATNSAGKMQPGLLQGKFAYMAPEQIRGLHLDGRADVFALGVTLYEMVTGERAFVAESEFSLLEKVRNVELKPPTMIRPDLPVELEQILFKAMAKDVNVRYRWASDLAEDLQRFLLMRGKPPSRNDLSQFLREHFTVDFEKERNRLEGYRDAQLEEEPELPALPAQPLGNAGEHNGPVLDDNIFATTPRSPAANGANAANAAGAAAGVAVGPAGSGQPLPVPAQTTANTTTTAGNTGNAGSGKKIAAIAAGVVIGVLALGGGAYALLQRSSTVVVTVSGAEEAKVRIDGKIVGDAAPSLTISDVSRGSHTLVVEQKGYQTFTQALEIQEKLVTVRAPLARIKGKLAVTSDPPGAVILVDGEEIGKKTPSIVEVDSDDLHQVTLKMDKYLDGTQSNLKVEASKEIPVNVKLKPKVVTIRVTSTPEGASVKRGGQDVGLTPYSFDYNPQDPYPQVTLSKTGCEETTTSIPFDADKIEFNFPVTLRCTP